MIVGLCEPQAKALTRPNCPEMKPFTGEIGMSRSRHGAITAAKRLLRTLASAPDPRLRARAFHAELAVSDDWTADDREIIAALGVWLHDNPPLEALRARCGDVLAKLAQSR